VQQAAGRADPTPVKDELISEKGSRYIDFLLPGLLGLNLLSTSVWGLSYSIVNARLKKTLKLMTATPMRKSDYLLSQMFSRFVLLSLEAAIIVLFGLLVFQVPMRGSPAALIFLCVFCGLAFAGLGLSLRIARADLEGVNGLISLILVPMWLFSGVFFPPSAFPASCSRPSRPAADGGQRGAARRHAGGKSLAAVPLQLAIIGLWGVASFVIALKIFRWQ
jgi:ABC-type multidrug transport system permease subunit